MNIDISNINDVFVDNIAYVPLKKLDLNRIPSMFYKRNDMNMFPIVTIILERLEDFERTYTTSISLSTNFDIVIYVGRDEFHELTNFSDLQFSQSEHVYKIYGHEVVEVNKQSYLSLDLRHKNINKKYKLDAINAYV